MALAHARRRDGLGGGLCERGVVCAGGGIEGAGLEAADEPADDLGRVGGGLLPEDAAREETRDGGVEDGAVESVGIVDG